VIAILYEKQNIPNLIEKFITKTQLLWLILSLTT
jgi:hypothetical protein